MYFDIYSITAAALFYTTYLNMTPKHRFGSTRGPILR